MPTLEWIGKDKVINHHAQVPFRVLEKEYTYNAEESENMIIRGDNLEALKALLPRYEGKIKCIYIDPPYNTGNEGWVYNDNVNDPHIKKWLGEVVGKEGEDLSRHDKWLCMMYPRLKLLHRLLAEDGAIFISIDDNEQANLRLICDEIFGARNFVSNISWQRTYSMRNDSKGIPAEIEYILVYSKQYGWTPQRLPRTAKMNANYKNPDNDPKGAWQNTSAFAPGAATHQGMVYAIQNPFSGKMIYPTNAACWRYSQDSMLEYMNGWTEYELRNLNDERKRAEICGLTDKEVRKDVMGIVLKKPLEIASQEAKDVLKKGCWPRFFFTNNGKGGIRRKTYLDNLPGKAPTNLWKFEDVGHTDEAAKTLRAIFEGKATFDTPKPFRLVEQILRISTDKNAIILDSFAGSGTTAHAVLNLNKSDGGNRRFILVEMNDYAESITAERVKRVIDGYGEGKNTVEGTGGDFSFYDLGEPLLMDGIYLNENVETEKIREYVWFTETGKPVPEITSTNEYYLGENNNCSYYFYYKKNSVTTLNDTFLSTIDVKSDEYVIYADKCVLSDEYLTAKNITFKKIPRDISKI